MTRETAQAGNRASKTGHYLQWWVNKSEQDAAISALQNLHHSAHFCLLLCSLCSSLYTTPLDVQSDGVVQAKTTMYEFRRLKAGDVSEAEVRFQTLPCKVALLACQSKFAS